MFGACIPTVAIILYSRDPGTNAPATLNMRHKAFAAPNKSTTDLASFAEIQKFSNNRRHHQPPHHTHNVEAWKVSGNSPQTPENPGSRSDKKKKEDNEKRENLTRTVFPLSSRADWADDEEFDDPSALPPQQITTNKDGTKTIVSYRFNDEGKKVKVTRRIKTTVVREHVNPQVAERRSWAKFGLEKGNAPGPSFDTTSVGENIAFRPSVNWKVQAAEAEKNGGEKGSMKDQLKDKKVKCRICSGEHFTARCPFKDTMAPVDEPSAGGEGGAEDSPAAGALGAGTSSYVPPHLRKGAAGGGERMAGKYEKDDLATLRVTNVSFPQLPHPCPWFYWTLFCYLLVSPEGEGGGVEGTGDASFPPSVPLFLLFLACSALSFPSKHSYWCCSERGRVRKRKQPFRAHTWMS